MRNTFRRTNSDKRTLIADWTTAVFTVFWSVWWGFFIARLLETKSNYIVIKKPIIAPSEWYKIPIYAYMLASVVIVCIYAILYVRWLWSAQASSYSSVSLGTYIRFSYPYLTITAILFSSILLVRLSAINISPLIVDYGLFLTAAWPLVMFITLWPDQ